jgi:hypothetical protein
MLVEFFRHNVSLFVNKISEKQQPDIVDIRRKSEHWELDLCGFGADDEGPPEDDLSSTLLFRNRFDPFDKFRAGKLRTSFLVFSVGGGCLARTLWSGM